MGCSVGTRVSSVAQVRRSRERDEPQTVGQGIRAGHIRADLEQRRIAGGARLGHTDRAYKITPRLLRLEMPHERAKAHHLRQMDDGWDFVFRLPCALRSRERLDASRACQAWSNTQVFLRAAPRQKQDREAEEVYPLALMSWERVSESGAPPEIPDGT